MRSCGVVVLDELCEHAFEMTLAADQQPVEALGPHGSDEPLGIRVCTRRAHGCADDSGAYRPQHFVERSDELGVAISDEEVNQAVLVLERRCKVSRLLGDPAPMG